MRALFFRTLLAIGAAGLAVEAAAAVQPDTSAGTVIALPPLTTPDNNNEALALAWQATLLIDKDLRQTSELLPIKPDQKDYYPYPEVTAPSFAKWRAAGAKALLTGFVQARADGRLTIGCYVYDVVSGRELGRQGFVISKSELRRAAHKCSALAYSAITGAPGMFDTRIAYVAESGAGDARIKRIAVMDSDGYHHSYVTSADSLALTPRFAPHGEHVAYVSFTDGIPEVRIVDLQSKEQRPLIPGTAITFAPRYSPDGGRIAFSMTTGQNTDIYIVGANGGIPRRLTFSPGIDTDPSFSPDGNSIVFESDRSGAQQLYVMNANGSNEHRISFGAGGHASPDWSPDGKLIAFTYRAGNGRRIGVMNADGTGEKLLTTGPSDEGPSWAPSSRELIFQRTGAGAHDGVYRVSLDGGQPGRIATPEDASDPDWSDPLD
ncbi:MAG TPA: Tol-Pal system beta propeller repeat protein TolB [Sphingomicrobium sp.]|nr:Tol-Pal system beta propeller repeat protein TolB [Sphingomicrobium sp.]